MPRHPPIAERIVAKKLIASSFLLKAMKKSDILSHTSVFSVSMSSPFRLKMLLSLPRVEGMSLPNTDMV